MNVFFLLEDCKYAMKMLVLEMDLEQLNGTCRL